LTLITPDALVAKTLVGELKSTPIEATKKLMQTNQNRDLRGAKGENASDGSQTLVDLLGVLRFL